MFLRILAVHNRPSVKKRKKTFEKMQTFKISDAIDAKEFKYPVVIGLTGPKGVGKTTLAHRIGGSLISFSTPIKKMLEVIVPKINIYEEKETQLPGFPEGVNARRLLQSLGTEFGRNHYPDIWVNFVEEKIAEEVDIWEHNQVYREFPLRIIIDDVRFRNEAEMIHRHKGEVWRLKRKGVEYLEDHVSERALPDEIIDKEIIADE